MTTGLQPPLESRGLLGLPVLEDLPPVSGRRVLVRADLNVPLRQTEKGDYEITDDSAFVRRCRRWNG